MDKVKIKINRLKLWNEWRKHNMNGPLHHFLVLIGFVKSPSFIGWCRFFEEKEEENE